MLTLQAKPKFEEKLSGICLSLRFKDIWGYQAMFNRRVLRFQIQLAGFPKMTS